MSLDPATVIRRMGVVSAQVASQAMAMATAPFPEGFPLTPSIGGTLAYRTRRKRSKDPPIGSSEGSTSKLVLRFAVLLYAGGGNRTRLVGPDFPDPCLWAAGTHMGYRRGFSVDV